MSLLRSLRPLLAMAVLVRFSVEVPAQYPDGGGGQVKPDSPAASASVTLPSEPRLRKKLEAAHDYVKAQNWSEAVRVLQILLEGKDDEFLPAKAVPAPNKPTAYSESVRSEALHLLADLPPKGRAAYEQAHGAPARALFKEAIERDDRQRLAELVQRYLYTAAGAEAAERLGAYHLDRGNADLAARYFTHLLSRPEAERLAPLTLYHAVLACRLAHDAAHEEKARELLAKLAPDGLTIGGQQRNLTQLRAAAARLPADGTTRRDWPIFRGDAARSSRGDGDLPLLEPLWTRSTISSKGRDWIDAGLRSQERSNRLILPGFYAIATPGRVIYRSHSGIHAVDPASGRDLWTKAALSPLSLDTIAANSGMAVVVHDWLQKNYADAHHFPIEGSALGCLSSDGERIYAIEDLAVPPPADVVAQRLSGLPSLAGPLSDALLTNRLRAVSIDTGAILWEKDGRAAGELHNCCFLGAPLPVAGQLYALADQEGEVRLLCLDPATGAVLWSQRLGTMPIRIALDPGRRLRGVQMTCAGGMLLCPTDAGALFAFDLVAHRLAWVHLYPSKKQAPEEGAVATDLARFNTAWRESAAVVADGKVVFAPSDSDEIHCISLHDGKPLWQQGQGQSAYFAGVYRDKVLLVGGSGIGTRALSLKDGRQVWVRNIGVPSGQGAANGNVYYLPLKRATESGGPGVLAFDADNGNTLAFAPARAGDVPGNLTFFGEFILSQTATSVTAYPRLKTRLKRVEELLAADPRNPRGLIERGTLRLHQGDVPAALADLRTVLELNPPGELKQEAHARLHETLKQAVQRNFAAGEKYLAELEASCRVPIPDGASPDQRACLELERRRREANYLLLLARGRESQGRMAEALAAYARLYGCADRVVGVWIGPEGGWVRWSQTNLSTTEEKPTGGGRDETPTRPRPVDESIVGMGCPSMVKRYAVPPNTADAIAALLKEKYKDVPSLRLAAVGNNEIMVYAPKVYQDDIANHLALGRSVFVHSQTEPVSVRPKDWVHGRITALLSSAKPEQRAEIEKEVARQWQALPANNVDELGRFVALFGTTGTLGAQARFTYAERLATRPDGRGFLEAELHLLALQRQSESPQLAARALELLARLLTEKGRPDEALYYYRQLAEDFGTTPVRDGKTGADFLKELAQDRRFMPLLDDMWVGRKYKTSEVRGVFPPPGQTMWLEPEGETPPCLRHQRLLLDLRASKLRLLDRNTGAELWSHVVSIGNLNKLLVTAGEQVWIPYRVEGHLAVVALGRAVYGIDLLDRRVLWQRQPGDFAAPFPEDTHGAEGPNDLAFAIARLAQSIHPVSPIRPAGVCVVFLGHVTAFDPFSGDTLWSMAGGDPRCHISADDAYVYLNGDGSSTERQAVSWRGGTVRALGPNSLRSGDAQVVGRNILHHIYQVPGRSPNHPSRLALYDLLTDKEIWTLPIAPGTWVAHSDVPHLTATVERSGKVHLWDLRRREELPIKGQIEPEHLRGVQEVRLFRDDTHYYLLLNRELRSTDNVAGPATLNAVAGMRGLPAHGYLYAFRRDNGSRHWFNEVRSQYLILEQFEQSPMVMFSAVVQRTNMRSPVLTFTTIDKNTGRMLWPPTDYALSVSPVNRVEINPAAGTIDLVTLRWKLRHTIAD